MALGGPNIYPGIIGGPGKYRLGPITVNPPIRFCTSLIPKFPGSFGTCGQPATGLVLTGCRNMHIEEMPVCDHHYDSWATLAGPSICPRDMCDEEVLAKEYIPDVYDNFG